MNEAWWVVEGHLHSGPLPVGGASGAGLVEA